METEGMAIGAVPFLFGLERRRGADERRFDGSQDDDANSLGTADRG